jgi:hypothetical protein
MGVPARGGGGALPSPSDSREEGELSPTRSDEARRAACTAASSRPDAAATGGAGDAPLAAWRQERAQWSGSDGEGGGAGDKPAKRRRKRRKRAASASGSDASDDASGDEAEASDAPAARRRRAAAAHPAAACRHWAAAACNRGTGCPFLHLGAPGSAAARNATAAAAGVAAPAAAASAAVAVALPEPPAGMALIPVPVFSPEQASRFRELLASPDAATRFDEVRALVGPLIPLRRGAPPGTAAPAGDPHARNCGCCTCRAARPGAGGEAEAEAALGEAAVAEWHKAVAERLDACRAVTHPRSVDAWRAVLVALRRA